MSRCEWARGGPYPRVWPGQSFGSKGVSLGEVVFNTSLTGYQEILTDASYAGQFVLFTCPEIGNVGINMEAGGGVDSDRRPRVRFVSFRL